MAEMTAILTEEQKRQVVLILATLEDYRNSVESDRTIPPVALLSSKKGFMIINLNSDLMNDGNTREIVFDLMRERAKEIEADIAILAMDMYEHLQTEDQYKEEMEYREINGNEPIPIEMRKALGLCKETKEGIMLLIETPRKSIRIIQYYEAKTDENGKRTIEFGDKSLIDCEPKMRIFA